MKSIKQLIPQRDASGPARRVGLYIESTSVTLSVLNVKTSVLEHCATHPITADNLTTVLSSMVVEHDLKGVPAYLTLDRHEYETQFVDLPGVGDREMRDAIVWQVTPPDGLTNDQCVATGTRLANDRAGAQGESTMIRATVMSRARLDELASAISAAGLSFRAAYARETALVTLAKQCVDDEALDAQSDEDDPPIMTVFIGTDNVGITVACGDSLYLSRNIAIAQNADGGLNDRQIDQLVTECVRTSTNFNSRLSSVPLAKALIGPEFPGVHDVRARIEDKTGTTHHTITLPEHVESRDEAVQQVGSTPAGMLAIAATLNTKRAASASIYEPPTPEGIKSSPRMLAAVSAAGLVVLVGLSAVQLWSDYRADSRLARAQADRDAEQAAVDEVEAAIAEAESKTADSALLDRVDSLERERETYQQIINDFDGINSVLIPAVAEPFRGLSKAVTDDVWLSAISMDANSVSIKGQTISTFQPETFISDLTEQPSFSGWMPTNVDINSPDQKADRITAYSFSIVGDALPAKRDEAPTANDAPSSSDSADEQQQVSGEAANSSGEQES